MNIVKTLSVLILVSLGAWISVTNYMTPELTIAQAEVKHIDEEEEEKMVVLQKNGENARKLYGVFVPPPPPPEPPVIDPMIIFKKHEAEAVEKKVFLNFEAKN